MRRQPQSNEHTRLEHDALGPVPVPLNRLWGAVTERSRSHFAIGDAGRVSLAARRDSRVRAGEAGRGRGQSRPWARSTRQSPTLIRQAADEVIAGRLDDEFPLGVFQTGSGTHSNMNANEVIANRANQLAGQEPGTYRPVHPNDHVNHGQSSNDVFPAVMHLATLESLDRARSRRSSSCAARWSSAPNAGATIPILGRTHLQDATPVMLGDVVASWASQIDHGRSRLREARAVPPPLAARRAPPSAPA